MPELESLSSAPSLQRSTSQVAFSKMFIPSLEGEGDLDELARQHRGLVRSMNRSALLLALCAQKLDLTDRKFIASHGADTAIYCAVEPTVVVLPASSPVPPKWALQCGASLVAPSLSILLGAEGGIHTFVHGRYGCLQALRQAQMDLRLGAVRAALVCAVSSAEDPSVVDRHSRLRPGSKYTEGAAIVALQGVEDGAQFELSEKRVTGARYFAVADPLVQTVWDRPL